MESDSPLEQVRREIREETGLSDGQFHLVCEAPTLEVPDIETQTCWMVHPFLFDVEEVGVIHLDWESSELRWVTPGQLDRYPTVPALADALAACLRQERVTRR